MREKFQDIKLIGKINIACRYDNAPTRYWTTTKQEVISHIVEIVTRYAKMGYKLTLRQLHYQLVTKNWIINHDTAYKKLGTILDDCRYGGIIDWNAIEDRGRVPYIPYSVDSVEEGLQEMHDYYRRDRQEGQNNIVEVWTEKDALSGILKRSTERYHVKLCVNKGYTSSSAIYEAYRRIAHQLADGKSFTILYFGDHDPSGLDMVRDITERLYFMFRNGEWAYEYGGEEPEQDITEVLRIIPIGLTMEQITRYKLPPNPTKLTDTRSAGYIREFGQTCWEVDALDPQVLTALVNAWIETQIDMDMYEHMKQAEKDDQKKIKSFIKTDDETDNN